MQLPFELRLNSPAFVGTAQQGSQNVRVARKMEDGSWAWEPRPCPYYPVDPGGIRIPSLRGVLSFWHRSLLGSVPSKEVFQSQARIFGSAEGGQGLTLRLEKRPEFKSGPVTLKDNPYSFVYLGYGPLQVLKIEKEGRRGAAEDVATSYNSNQCRDAILLEPAARFRFVGRGNAEQLKALKSALILLHLFGGIGSRSRRGWGSVEVVGLSPLRQKNEGVSPWITRALDEVPAPDNFASLSWGNLDFSAFSRDTEVYVTGSLEKYYEDVLLQFFECFEDVRSWRKRRPLAKLDHNLEMYDATRSGSVTDIPQRLAFGLPYHPRSRAGGWDIEYLGRSASSDDASRRASPLILKVLRVGDGYAGVALFLKSRFFGDPGMQVGAFGKTGTKPFPGYKAVEDFLRNPIWNKVKLPW